MSRTIALFSHWVNALRIYATINALDHKFIGSHMSSKRKFGFWRTLYCALYSRSLYRDVAKNWVGSAALYLLLLTTLSLAFNSVTMLYGLSNSYSALDAQTTEISQTSSSTVISDDDSQQIDISTETKATTGGHGSLAKIIIIGLNVVFSVIGYVTILLASLVAATMSKIFVGTLTFKALYRLAIVATTPSFLLGSIFFILVPARILPELSTAFPAVFFFIPLGYFIYGIRANVAHKEQLKIKLGE
jgi:hypothetical protein